MNAPHASTLDFEGRTIALDTHGHLKNPEDWNKALAEHLAAADNLVLTHEHWEIIAWLQDYHRQYAMLPPMRLFIKALAKTWPPEKACSRHLYRLFPAAPIRQACRYGGLPKPISCI